MIDRDQIRVFYDGKCPLCKREINFYKRRAGAKKIIWEDVSRTLSIELLPGFNKTQALRRFHIFSEEYGLISGAAAFAALWKALPGFRWIGLVFRKQPLLFLLEILYRGFLLFRPFLQKTLKIAESSSKAKQTAQNSGGICMQSPSSNVFHHGVSYKKFGHLWFHL